MTPYQLTLAALVIPWRVHMLLNVATGVAFGLVVGPYLALLWIAGLAAGDALLQRLYGRLNARATSADSDRGMRRLVMIGLTKVALWLSVPTVFVVMTHSPIGLAFVFVLTIILTALAVSTFRNSRQMFLAMATLPVAALAACVVAVIGARAGAGPLVGIAIIAGMLFHIASGTNRTVANWNRASQQAEEAMASMKAALARSEAAERRLQLAVEIGDLYVFEADYVRRTFTGSGAEPELFGQLYGGDAFWEDPFRNVFPEDLPRVRAAWASYAAGEGPYKVEHRGTGPDGSILWVSASAEYIRDEMGRPRALIGTLRNITERKRGELELTEALVRAEAGSRAKSEFLTIMNHETRTPLNGVLGMVQAMEADALAPAQRVRLDVVRKSAEALLVLLNSVLDLAKIEAGELAFEDGEIDIALVAGAALNAFEAAATEKGLSLALEVAPKARGVYAGDPARVGQVLSNLVSNAVKFTDAGSVSVTVERSDDALIIHVADTGIGISADQKRGLFETFVQADASLTRRHGGSGLGLAICRQLTAKMGGTLDLRSRPGRGSTFTVTLRLPRLGDAGDRAAGAPGDQPAAVQAPLKILVAEDNPVNQLVLRTLLQQVGIEPRIVADGEQAVAAWRGGDWDIILMDIQMPLMDGVTASRTIRDEEGASGRPRTPIVAVTANVMVDQVQTYRTAGIDDVVAKPVQVARLIDAIECALAAQAPSIEPPVAAAAV
jgi:signal transduction histidine kinase/ActR/RegA family two-component response regulator